MLRMTERELLQGIGEKLFHWEFWKGKEAANMPYPLDPIYETLAGKRGPIFWPCGCHFLVAVPGAKGLRRWNPLQNEEQLGQVIAEVQARGGRVAVHQGWIAVERAVDGHCITKAGGCSPKHICEAALDAISTEPLDC